MHDSPFSSSSQTSAVGFLSGKILAGSLGLCLLAFTFGCSTEDDETPEFMYEGNATLKAETATNPAPTANAAPTASIDTAPTGSVGPGEMSMDDLAFDEPTPTTTTSPSPLAGTPEKKPPVPAAAREIPQVVLDAPVKRFVDRYEDETPRKVFEAKFFDGGRIMYHGSFIEYRPDGSKFKAGRYLFNQKDGVWTYWNRAGKVVRHGRYVDNNPEGEFRLYRDDGTLNRVEHYVHGLADGVWIAYQDDGKAKLWERGFKAKKPDGVWTEFYEDGTKRLEMPFKSGKKHGPLRQWYENGKLAVETLYANGKRHGISKEYDVAGNLRDERQWENGKRKISGQD